MASKGTEKDLSNRHEQFIARRYDGVVSPSSGAADNDSGDVRTAAQLIECKRTGKPGKPARSAVLSQFEKIAQEAYAEGREPMLALRFFAPDSPLADYQGWVDLAVRRVHDDIQGYE